MYGLRCRILVWFGQALFFSYTSGDVEGCGEWNGPSVVTDKPECVPCGFTIAQC